MNNKLSNVSSLRGPLNPAIPYPDSNFSSFFGISQDNDSDRLVATNMKLDSTSELKACQFSISEGISIPPLQLATTGDGVSQMRPRTGENSNHKPKTDQKIDSFDRLRILYEMIISGECSTPENGGEVRWSRDLRRGAKRCVKYT